MSIPPRRSLGKLSTHIPGLDSVLDGGLPELSINIITGPPGAGKTIFTQQIIYTNATPQKKALYLITLSEPSVKMLHYLQQFSFFDPQKVGSEVIYLDIGEVIRDRGLDESINAIIKHVQDYKPSIVGIDSFKAIHDIASDPIDIRKFAYDLSVRLTSWAVTGLFVGEYTEKSIEEEPIFAIADGIIRLHNQRNGLHYQRYIDVQKMRGSNYFTGLHPMTINENGLTVYPRLKLPYQGVDIDFDSKKVNTGIDILDQMLHGGLSRGTATMIAGSAGTGKTLTGLHFITKGAIADEPGVIVTFQESRRQLQQIAGSFGWDLVALEAENKLKLLYTSPVEIQPDIHAVHVLEAVERCGAKRVLLDSLKDIEIATPDKVRYKDYIYSLVSQLKQRGITTILTNEIPELFGPFQLSEFGVSFVMDNVILLRYVEIEGEIGRALNIMKVRGSQHSKEIRFFEITQSGIRILGKADAQTGVLTGMPVGRRQSPIDLLPLRARLVISTLKQNNTAMTIAELVTLTGLSQDILESELVALRDQGMVIVSRSNSSDRYKATI